MATAILTWRSLWSDVEFFTQRGQQVRMIAPNCYRSAIDDESDAFCNLAIGGERGVDGHIFTIQALE